MLLLEGIDNHGLGNWSAVGKCVSTKTAAECKEHYFDIYIRFLLQASKPLLNSCNCHAVTAC